MCVTQLSSNSMNPKLSPTAKSITATTHARTRTSKPPPVHFPHLHNLLKGSKFFLCRNNHASGTLGWIFKSSGVLLTRTCLPRCPAVGSMWCTKPRLSMPSTHPGWKANWEDAQLLAPSIHYQVIATSPQLLERRCLKIASLRIHEQIWFNFKKSEAHWLKHFRSSRLRIHHWTILHPL